MASAGDPAVSIVLHPPAADPGVTDDERRIIAEMMAKGTYAAILPATAEQPYGVRDCAVRDPAGNLIRINELRHGVRSDTQRL
jgi:hypothetical protein